MILLAWQENNLNYAKFDWNIKEIHNMKSKLAPKLYNENIYMV